MVYESLFRSHLDYGSPVDGSESDTTLRRLNVLQNEYVRMWVRALRCTSEAWVEDEGNLSLLPVGRDS